MRHKHIPPCKLWSFHTQPHVKHPNWCYSVPVIFSMSTLTESVVTPALTVMSPFSVPALITHRRPQMWVSRAILYLLFGNHRPEFVMVTITCVDCIRFRHKNNLMVGSEITAQWWYTSPCYVTCMPLDCGTRPLHQMGIHKHRNIFQPVV